MNPVGLYFASGESLYVGAVLLLLAIGVSPYLKRHFLLRLRNLAAWLALAMIVMACPPFALAVDAIFIASFLTWFIASNRTGPGRHLVRLRLAARVVLFTLLLVLPALELSHRAIPVISGAPSDHLVVIGDSISAGIDSRAPAWPVVMEQLTGVPVKNLSRPGALAVDGQTMAARVTPEDRLVLIEIGGNDLLTGVPSNEFGQGLEAMIARIAAPGRTVVMFELPLFPHKIAYGQIQRRIATKYGISLIPKRYFTDLIGGANATLDGLHLSDAGAHRMAALVAQILSPVLKGRPEATAQQKSANLGHPSGLLNRSTLL
jgi:acyl-CoA thioesterase I